jgi:hypothetical protein
MIPQSPPVRMIVLLLLGMPSVLFGRRWRCDACQNVWRRSIYEESDDDDEKEREAREQPDERESD